MPTDYPSTILSPGTPAPQFTLPSGPEAKVSLAELRGSRVILAFYPADWSPVCGDQLAVYNEILPEFERFRAKLIGLSVDGVWCHQAYRKNRGLDVTLVSDFEPKGEVAKRYGAYHQEWGVAQRALFVIDADGVIRWSYLSPIDVNPGADGILAALEELSGEESSSGDGRAEVGMRNAE